MRQVLLLVWEVCSWDMMVYVYTFENEDNLCVYVLSVVLGNGIVTVLPAGDEEEEW